jgi:predicted nucleic acid-binding protein
MFLTHTNYLKELAFRSQCIRILTIDLTIASIAITHNTALFTRNTVDFAEVPGLRFESWLD